MFFFPENGFEPLPCIDIKYKWTNRQIDNKMDDIDGQIIRWMIQIDRNTNIMKDRQIDIQIDRNSDKFLCDIFIVEGYTLIIQIA